MTEAYHYCNNFHTCVPACSGHRAQSKRYNVIDWVSLFFFHDNVDEINFQNCLLFCTLQAQRFHS